MNSKFFEVFIIVLIFIYTALVFANIVLDTGCNQSAQVKDALFALKIVEMVILGIFSFEIIFKCLAFGFKVN